MAYASLVSLAQTIDLILQYHQDFISPQVENQVLSIRQCVDVILQAFLENFPDKANSLEEKIRDVTYAAEDAIEFLLSKQIHDSFVGQSKYKFTDIDMDTEHGKSFQFCAGYYGSKHRTWEKYGHLRNDLCNLNKATKGILSMAEKVMEIKNSITVKDVHFGDSAATSSTVAPVHKDLMIGCGEDLEKIKFRLYGESSKLIVIPITGMGGIGKTTLARNVYDDPLIVERFDICGWVTVSQDYNVQDIASGLLVSMKVLDAKNEKTKAHEYVHKNLKGRRYFIVMDDIWSIKAWDDLKMMFPDDGNRSRIMLTTRLSDVASYPDPYYPIHEMRLMKEDQSWDLIRQKVFKQDPCPLDLVDVGKTIARSCRGLPLAIVVISGLLTNDQTKTAWENIARDVKSAISANDEQFDKILSLSYTCLPHHLRPCFLYMACFPEDNEIRVTRLIKQWVAEGFLKPNGRKRSEETAEEYLEDLVKRNLVLITKRKPCGKIKFLSIHDLLREMCLRKSQEENFSLHAFEFLPKGIKFPRRLSIFHNNLDFLENIAVSTIRTIVRVNTTKVMGSPCCLGYLRLLRIMNMSGAHGFFYPHLSNGSLAAELFELLHLRYLALDYYFKIPAAISNLQNLQTLIIKREFSNMRRSVELPAEIWRMPQLRHLIVYYCDLPVSFEAGYALENLHTLSGARNFVFTPKILKMTPNLKKLSLYYDTSEDICEEEYQLDNLIYLQQLENLKLEIDYAFPYREKVNPAFPRTMKKLTLSRLGLPWKDMAMVGCLPNLEVLKLRHHAFIGDTWETTEGEFSQLKFLEVDISFLEHWMTESSHFPKIKCLVLRFCPKLKEIPDGIGEIPTLELIEVSDMLLVQSAKQIQEEQLSTGYDAIQVRVPR